MTTTDCRIRVDSVELTETPVQMRMPFRYGVVTLREAPQSFVAVRISDAAGRTADRDDLVERLAFDQRHRDEGLAVGFVDLVDGANVCVVEGRGGASLSFESFDHFGQMAQLGSD